MAWAKIDDKFPEHEKVVGLSNAAFRLHVSAICYAARNETDGRILPAAARALRGRPRDMAELVSAGLWELRGGDGWAIHDYLLYNPSHADLEKKREAARKRVANARSNSHPVRANKKGST